MKKIFIFALALLAFAFTSCEKEDPVKDVDLCIKKLNHFNKTYAEFNADGVISQEKTLGKKQDKSEFSELKKIASEYYELVNKINKKVKEEKEDAEEGKKIDNYEEAYKKELEAKNAEIEEAVAKFEANINAMKAVQ